MNFFKKIFFLCLILLFFQFFSSTSGPVFAQCTDDVTYCDNGSLIHKSGGYWDDVTGQCVYDFSTIGTCGPEPVCGCTVGCLACGPRPFYTCCGGNVCNIAGGVVETCTSGCSEGDVCQGDRCYEDCTCCCPTHDAWCNGDVPDGDPYVPNPNQLVVGRVWKDGIQQTGYSITSIDGKTAEWHDDNGYWYGIGRWVPNAQVTISLNNPDPGFTCQWSFGHPSGIPETISGMGCSATVTITVGPNSPDAENHLTWFLVPPPPPTCSITASSSSISQGQTVTLHLTGQPNVSGNQTVEIHMNKLGFVNFPEYINLLPRPNYYPSSLTAYAYKFNFDPYQCTASNYQPCTPQQDLVLSGLPVGIYQFFCQTGTNNGLGCTGHPGCTFNNTGAGTLNWPCEDWGWLDCNNTTTAGEDWITITVGSIPAWYQARGGNIHAQGSLNSIIPEGISGDKRFLLNLDNYPGTISYNSSANFGSKIISDPTNYKISSKEWATKASFTLSKYSPDLYTYFYNKIGERSQPLVGEPVNSGIWRKEGDLLISGGSKVTVNNGAKVIVFVTGDLIIDKKIEVPINANSSLVFIVQGDIKVKGGVGDKSNNIFTGANAHLQGIFITNKTFYSYEDKPATGMGNGNRLVVGGVIIAQQGFNLARDFVANGAGLPQDFNTPAEQFIFRPDLIANSHDDIWSAKTVWNEVAP